MSLLCWVASLSVVQPFLFAVQSEEIREISIFLFVCSFEASEIPSPSSWAGSPVPLKWNEFQFLNKFFDSIAFDDFQLLLTFTSHRTRYRPAILLPFRDWRLPSLLWVVNWLIVDLSLPDEKREEGKVCWLSNQNQIESTRCFCVYKFEALSRLSWHFIAFLCSSLCEFYSFFIVIFCFYYDLMST